MIYTSPEKCGVSPKAIKKYLSLLEGYGLSTHSVIMARGDRIFFEKYYPPFDKNTPHRMYSVTKSFVAIAVGFLLQDGRLSLDDKIADHFKNDTPEDVFPNVKEQTVRDMLMMSTGFVGGRGWWFSDKKDRVKYYFDKSSGELDTERMISKIPGSFFEYDSNGSFILGALVERISGKTLVEYLREKLFDKIGVSEAARCLKCPGGHSWSDSALICTPLDLLKTARFTLNYGAWQGEQLLSADYLREATDRLIDNSVDGNVTYNSFGYGYQFWRTWQNSFFFNGMGCQLAVCVPHKDMILVYTGDNQGNLGAKSVIIDRFFDEIVDTAENGEIPAEKEAEEELCEYAEQLKLRVAYGSCHSPLEGTVSGREYTLEKNPMGITRVKLTFDKDRGTFEYTNKRGDKRIDFGLKENVFTFFPESYSKDIGGIIESGNLYKCAASAAWTEETKLGISVQIIDEYLGRLYISVSFKDERRIALLMTKSAEDFLHGYSGYAQGTMAEKSLK